MTKIGAIKTTNGEKVREAKRAFYFGLADLSWKLAAAFFIPLLAGAAIDNRRGDSKLFTAIGFTLGILAGAALIARLVRDSKISPAELKEMKKVPEEEDD